MAGFSDSAHWRDSAKNAKFFLIDARAAFPLLLFILNIAWWTFYTAIITMFLFGLLEKAGYTLPVFFRLVRYRIAGNYKTSSPWWRE